MAGDDGTSVERVGQWPPELPQSVSMVRFELELDRLRRRFEWVVDERGEGCEPGEMVVEYLTNEVTKA